MFIKEIHDEDIEIMQREFSSVCGIIPNADDIRRLLVKSSTNEVVIKIPSESSKHYFVSFQVINGYDNNAVYSWIPAHSVINRHPFEFMAMEQARCKSLYYTPNGAILTSYQEITEEEYYLFEKHLHHEKTDHYYNPDRNKPLF